MALRFSTLDRRSIRRLKPCEKITEHGITAQRLVDGDLRYSVNVMVDGKRIHRVIGKESDGITRTQCEEFLERSKSEARAGRLSLPKGRKLSLSFGAAADNYIERLEDGAGKNIAIKRRQLRMHLKPFFGATRLDAITRFAVDRYKKKRIDAGAANGTINRELATLSHLLSTAVEWKWLDKRPCRFQMLGESPGRVIALSDNQCAALMRAGVESADAFCWLFVAFGLNTAMRHSEILAARFDKIDFDKRRLFVPDAKGGQRAQPITSELAEMLRGEREMRDDRAGWIFPSLHRDSRTGHRARMDKPFRDAVVRAGLDPELVTPHVMRHTAITALVQAGVDLPTIQKISGHKTLAMVLRYAHVHGQHIDRAIGAIGRTIPELLPNKGGSTITQELHTGSRGKPLGRPKNAGEKTLLEGA
jgi:integrase